MIIDKNNSQPLYIQLKNVLKKSIMSGDISEGEAIPSETQLAEKYKITRNTVRMAITELVNENLLRREHGKGTFVRFKPISHSMLNFSSFSEYLQKKDKIPVSKILEAEKVRIDSRDFFKLVRARGIKEDGCTLFLTVDRSLIPLDLFPGISGYDFEKLSLYRVMHQEFHIRPDRVELSIQPQLAGKEFSAIFNIKENEPLLCASGNVYSADNQLVEQLKVTYSPQIDFKLVTQIHSRISGVPA